MGETLLGADAGPGVDDELLEAPPMLMTRIRWSCWVRCGEEEGTKWGRGGGIQTTEVLDAPLRRFL